MIVKFQSGAGSMEMDKEEYEVSVNVDD